MAGRDKFTPVAEQIPFDNDTNDFVADDVQAAIEEVKTSASPGFSFGRSGNVTSSTWLQNEGVPSNKAGRFVYITNAVVDTLFVSNENVATYDVSIYYHDGDEINLTLVSTSSVVAARGDSFTINQSIPTGKQLAVRVTSGSARNIICGLELSGTN